MKNLLFVLPIILLGCDTRTPTAPYNDLFTMTDTVCMIPNHKNIAPEDCELIRFEDKEHNNTCYIWHSVWVRENISCVNSK